MKICLQCGTSFRAERSTKRFCSTRCRVAYARAQQLSVTENPSGGTKYHSDAIYRDNALHTSPVAPETSKEGISDESEGALHFHRINEVTVRVSEGRSDKAVAWIMEVGWVSGRREAWHVRWKDIKGRQLSYGPVRLAKAKQLVPLLISGGFGDPVTHVRDPVKYLQRITLEAFSPWSSPEQEGAQ
jgi:hypothetical protein